ncbi:Gfo/Idh/MocA family protein [Zhihengliuella flava]|uniref:Dehydrogenase n=1 Tax=Zhihengliuella flava TaxID=1285193 RepID=A0A931D501_9MICC|nr:Gfo/Idh/MocA family oxidoreductase [Zhihengliuella flava]MBG6083830.1 putative dehydrogenase [Zhihengliuella flava]
MSTLRWGILATGMITHLFTQDAVRAGLHVTSVGSRSRASAEAFAAEFSIPHAHGSYAELVASDDVDIVYIGTPHPMHYANAVLALEHGKHVLVEKPLTLNAAEAAALRDLARSQGLLLMEAMWTRYLPHMERIRHLLHAGGIGEVRALMADHTQSISTDPSHRLNALELGGGSLLDLGIYPISLAWDLLGQPTAVTASARLSETGADAEVATIMTHASGALSTSLSTSRSAGPNQAHILGTAGRIEVDSIWYNATSFTHYDAAGEVVERYRSSVPGRGMQYQALAAERFITEGSLDSDLLPLDESVAIMGTLDEVRRQIGVVYPGEGEGADVRTAGSV